MQIVERSVSSQNKRPRPLLYVDSVAQQAVILTNWGSPDHTSSAMDTITQYLVTAQADVEVTSPFESVLSFSRELNALRHALLIGNDFTYRSTNKDSLESGYEVLALWKKNNEMNWARVGAPNIYLRRRQQLHSVSSHYPLEVELDNQGLAPLPSELLGLERQVYVHCGSFLMQPEDSLFLCSHQMDQFHLEGAHPTLSHEALLNEYSHHLVQRFPAAGAWLGLVSNK